MDTAAGWFLGRREARGDRFGKDNFSCIGLGVQAMHSGVQRRAAPIGFMRWSSPEAPILQFVVLHALEKRESSFASQMRVSCLVCLFFIPYPSSRDRSIAQGTSAR